MRTDTTKTLTTRIVRALFTGAWIFFGALTVGLVLRLSCVREGLGTLIPGYERSSLLSDVFEAVVFMPERFLPPSNFIRASVCMIWFCILCLVAAVIYQSVHSRFTRFSSRLWILPALALLLFTLDRSFDRQEYVWHHLIPAYVTAFCLLLFRFPHVAALALLGGTTAISYNAYLEALDWSTRHHSAEDFSFERPFQRLVFMIASLLIAFITKLVTYLRQRQKRTA